MLFFFLRNYVVVEFLDGLEVVSKNWKIDDTHFYYPKGVKDKNEYHKIVLNLTKPFEEKYIWTSYEIIRIRGSDGNVFFNFKSKLIIILTAYYILDVFLNAIEKLKLAEYHSDIDDNSKKKRQKRCKKKANSSENEGRTSPLVFQHKTKRIKKTKISKIDTTLPDIPSTLCKFIHIS